MMEIVLKPFDREYETQMLRYMVSFFGVHHLQLEEMDVRADLADWTSEGHDLYEILRDEEPVGFVHLYMRGPDVCWIEDIFVDERLRRQGIASKAIGLIEEILQKRHVEGICMDVVPDNLPALRLYHRLGYDRLSIVTVRKDMKPFTAGRIEQICGMEFRVKQFEDEKQKLQNDIT